MRPTCLVSSVLRALSHATTSTIGVDDGTQGQGRGSDGARQGQQAARGARGGRAGRFRAGRGGRRCRPGRGSGAGGRRQLHHRPRSGRCPAAAATSPPTRGSALTANAPAGPVPTNDWWSLAAVQEGRAAPSASRCTRTRRPTTADRRRARLLVHDHARRSPAPPTGVGEYHFPYARGPRRRASPGSTPPTVAGRRLDRLDRHPVLERRHPDPARHHRPRPAVRRTTRSPAATRRSTTAGAHRLVRNSGARIGFTRRAATTTSRTPRPARPGRSAAAPITSTLAGKGYFSVAVLPTTVRNATRPQRAWPATLRPVRPRARHRHPVSLRLRPGAGDGEHHLRVHHHRPRGHREPAPSSRSTRTSGRSLTGATPIAQTYVVAARPDEGAGRRVVASRTSDDVHTACCRRCPRSRTARGADRDRRSTSYLDRGRGPTRWRATASRHLLDRQGPRPRRPDRRDRRPGRRHRSPRHARSTRSAARSPTGSPPRRARPSGCSTTTSNWGTLIGYPASYGSDQELNDHHFHYGYFIAAAATLAKFDPTWAADRASTAAWSTC